MFEPQIRIVTEVKWNGEDEVEISCDGTIWAGSKRKDFWGADGDWESRIKPGVRLRYWTVQYSRVIGFELEEDGKWIAVWCKGNDFRTKAENEVSSKAYSDFIEKEGAKIAIAIDDGKTLKEIDEAVDDGHSGNTYACSLAIGIRDAKNRDFADAVKKEHNKKYDVESDGVVNPAILTIG